MKKTKILLLTVFFLFSMSLNAQDTEIKWPKSVLITNDDGISDEKMIAMALAFSEIAETYIIAPIDDKSGSSHYASVFSKHFLTAEKQDIDNSITAYQVDGYPADCIFFALKGLMKDNPPDLVISGINGGPNLGYDWMASGTIGAARMAAFWGVPAIAVSGFKGDSEKDLKKIIEWIINFSQSDLVKKLNNGQYLTVSFPCIPVEQIKGVKTVKRAGILLEFEMKKAETDERKPNLETWQIIKPKPVKDILTNSDASFYYQNYIVIVPMVADEIDYDLLEELEKSNEIPKWKID